MHTVIFGSNLVAKLAADIFHTESSFEPDELGDVSVRAVVKFLGDDFSRHWLAQVFAPSISSYSGRPVYREHLNIALDEDRSSRMDLLHHIQSDSNYEPIWFTKELAVHFIQ